MTFFSVWIKKYFTKQPLPHTALQFTSSYISGINVSGREGKIKSHFIFPVENGVIQPSFDKPNIKNPSWLENNIREGLSKLRLSDRKIACLIPELSLKAFVFSFESLPTSRLEREQIIRYRIKKKIPLLPPDARFAFDLIKSDVSVKIFATVARASVIKEYEDFLDRFQLKVRFVGIPTLSLYHLLDTEKAKDVLLINVEDDSLSLLGVINSEIVLYRLKPFLAYAQTDSSGLQRIESIVKEVENTVHFMEDKEERKVQSLCFRSGLMRENQIFSVLREKAPLPLTGIESRLSDSLGVREKKILSPLIGQILC